MTASASCNKLLFLLLEKRINQPINRILKFHNPPSTPLIGPKAAHVENELYFIRMRHPKPTKAVM